MRTLVLLALAACTPVPGGHPLTPARDAPSAVAGQAPAPSKPVAPVEPGVFADDDQAPDEAPETHPVPHTDDTLAAMARFADTPKPAAPATVATPAPVWDPSRPLPDVSFGVRVLGVLLDLNPPRAILGLPDGREQVVTPGAMLPAEGVVVLAIGRDAVQIARITPQGFYARVETETVMALSPTRVHLLPVPSAP